MNIHEQVERAIRNYEDLRAKPFSPDLPDEDAYLATPDRLAFALGWIVAGAIVGARYAGSGIDALPVYHPEHGWDRFLLTRRVTDQRFRDEPADRFGMIALDGDDAPRLTKPSGETKLALGPLLRADPEAAIEQVVGLIPRPSLPDRDMGRAWRERQRVYPLLYSAVTEVVVEHPGVVAAREIFVDNQPVDGAYHPLYLHGIAIQPALVYDWFLVQYQEQAVFFRVHGGQTIYRTERGTWSTVKKQLAGEPPEGMKRRILAWLRIEGEPDPAVD